MTTTQLGAAQAGFSKGAFPAPIYSQLFDTTSCFQIIIQLAGNHGQTEYPGKLPGLNLVKSPFTLTIAVSF